MFCINAYKMVSVHSFQKAEEYYNKTKPVRGCDKNLHGVPLRSDRRNWRNMYLRKVKAGDDYAYACRLYRTDVVTFYRDGAIMVDTSYNSQSTNRFAEYFAPVLAYHYAGYPVIRAYTHDSTYDSGFIVCTKPITLRHSLTSLGMTTYTIDTSDTPKMVVPFRKRKEAGIVRNKLAPLVAYINTMQSLGPISIEAYKAMKYDSKEPLRECLHTECADIEMMQQVVKGMYRTRWVDGKYMAVIEHGAVQAMYQKAYEMTPGVIGLRALPTGVVHKKMRQLNAWEEATV
jgi:hypothetical protein